MRKTLAKYTKTIGTRIHLPYNHDLLFYIDNLLYYHKKHIRLRKIVEKMPVHIYEKNSEELELYKKAFTKLANKQLEINGYIKSFFILIIIEIANILEYDKIFKEQINSKFPIIKYSRIRRKSSRPVEKIADQIIHFRDACVHNRKEGISTRTQFKKNNIHGGEIHLDFTCDLEKQERVFMIGEGIMNFETIEKIIKEFLIYFYNQ